jgi:hypothetical protein
VRATLEQSWRMGRETSIRFEGPRKDELTGLGVEALRG